MKRIVAFGLLGVVLVCAPGCGGPDALMKEFIANLNLLADTIEKKEPADRQEAARERVRATAEKIDKLKLSAEDKEKLLKKYEPELKKAKERIDTALKNQLLEGGVIQPNPLDGFLK